MVKMLGNVCVDNKNREGNMIDDKFIEVLKRLEKFILELKKEYNLTGYEFRLINEEDYVTLKGEK